MNVPGEFQEVGLLFANDGPVPILKEMPVPPVPAVEVHGKSGEKLPHGRGERLPPGPKQQVEVVGQERPGKDLEVTALAEVGQASQEILTVRLGREQLDPGDAPADHMMEGSGRVEAGLAWHGGENRRDGSERQVVFSTNVPVPSSSGIV
jgi:hypothetical protein